MRIRISTSQSGFTLVELSIVLVIIGLLIGGILIGQSLIESARIRAQIQQLEQFDIAVTNFKKKFKCMPGDCTMQFVSVGNWAAGNGDGMISCPSTSLWPEMNMFWPTLSQSGMMKGNYRQVSGTTTIGVDSAKLAIGRGGAYPSCGNTYKFYYFLGVSADTTGGVGTYTTISPNGVLSPTEALALDQKIDDGIPGTGEVAVVTNVRNGTTLPYPFTLDTTAAACTTAGTAYNTSRTETDLCRLFARMRIY